MRGEHSWRMGNSLSTDRIWSSLAGEASAEDQELRLARKGAA